MGRKPTVNGETAAQHSQFAREMTAYLNHIREDSGLSVRGVSALTPDARSNSWWAEIFNGRKILTTNDVHYIAANLLGLSPYKFVDNARRYASGEAVSTVRFNVGALPDDVDVLSQAEEQALRKSDLGLAAYRGRNEAETPTAD